MQDVGKVTGGEERSWEGRLAGAQGPRDRECTKPGLPGLGRSAKLSPRRIEKLSKAFKQGSDKTQFTLEKPSWAA